MLLFLHRDKQHLSGLLVCIQQAKLRKGISAVFCRILITALTLASTAKT